MVEMTVHTVKIAPMEPRPAVAWRLVASSGRLDRKLVCVGERAGRKAALFWWGGKGKVGAKVVPYFVNFTGS
jgi:hypothetical protein